MPRVIAITGGKGGVGKTSMSINLAIALSRTGSRVCLFDADTGLANINIMLGLYPAHTLEHLFTGEKSIQDIVVEGPEGIQIIPGASGFAQCVELEVGQQQRLVTAIRSLEPHYDYMLVDTAAGISPTVLHFIAASQVAAVVVTPEPTSLTDAFSLLKVLRRRGYRRKVQVIVNMASNSTQAEKVFRRFSRAVSKYLDLMTDYLGSVWMDESMRTAVTLQRPVALFPKNDPSARSFYRLAERIDDVFCQPGVPKLAFSAYWQKLVERHAGRDIESKSVAEVPQSKLVRPDVSLSLSQVQKQLEDKQAAEKRVQRVQQQAKVASSASASTVVQPLSHCSEDKWVDLRVRLNQFFSDENTTPEQVTTLLSSGIYSYGNRLGEAAVDLLHGLAHTLNPDKMSDEQKRLLLADYEYLGLEAFKQSVSNTNIESIKGTGSSIEGWNETTHGDNGKERYDAEGFGCQQNLAAKIKSASEGLPLESLLESIKYASLVDSTDEV